MTTENPFKYFKTSPKVIRLAVMYYVRYPPSFRQVEDILHERGVEIRHETFQLAALICVARASMSTPCWLKKCRISRNIQFSFSLFLSRVSSSFWLQAAIGFDHLLLRRL